MISRDRRCVAVANNSAEAGMIVALLGGFGIEAEVMNEATQGGLVGVTGLVPRAGLFGLEIWVNDLTRIPEAIKLLTAENERFMNLRDDRQSRTGNVIVACDECRKQCVFPASEQGTVQSCVHCGAYVDVPDPNDDWPEYLGEPEE